MTASASTSPRQGSTAIVSCVDALAREHGHSVRRMPSGSGHDAQMLARMCPAAMIFAPSVAALSHNVKEFTHDADIVAGASLLLALLCELADDP